MSAESNYKNSSSAVKVTIFQLISSVLEVSLLIILSAGLRKRLAIFVAHLLVPPNISLEDDGQAILYFSTLCLNGPVAGCSWEMWYLTKKKKKLPIK